MYLRPVYPGTASRPTFFPPKDPDPAADHLLVEIFQVLHLDLEDLLVALHRLELLDDGFVDGF